MKTIIAGGREAPDALELVSLAVEACEFKDVISEIVHGGARGIDSAAGIWAKNNSISVREFIPDWDLYGKRAGHLRNGRMSFYSDALIAIWDGKSAGTKNMIETARKDGLKVFIFEY